MRLRPLLVKELVWSKRNVVALVVLLVAVPAVFAGASVGFQTVIPTDMPIGVVGTDGDVTDDDLTIVEGAVTFFSDPVRYDSKSTAIDDLRRERVYAVVEVPPNVGTRSDGRLDFTLYVDGSLVPFRETSKVITNNVNARLSSALPMDVRISRTVVEPTHTLPEYLIPLLLFGVVALFAFTFVPYNLAGERTALDRIRTESSLEALVIAKLTFFTALMAVPLIVFRLATGHFGYDVAVLAPGAIAALLLSFLFMAAVAMAIMFLTRFSTSGRFVNVILLFGLFAFGGLIYPVGFFSSIRRAIARLIPLHYGMILTRSAMLKDVPLDIFSEWFAGLFGVVVLAGIGLELTIVAYRRRST
ncbi:ABC transporter permease [Halorhabdus amylolytica]|uniref:ABC transporter permease n=1 Tax=Halorhabdus amylolytica TaxID=2559573 RepID=UPI0010AAA6BF|nr:ABC transporter permease [Halorhabdus amylolytica]